MASQQQPVNKLVPMLTLSVTLMVSMVILGWLAYTSHLWFGETLARGEETNRVETLRSRVVRHHETLTNAARMVILTNDEGWKKRYQTSEAAMNEDLATLEALSKQTYGLEGIEKIRVANQRLVRLQQEAMTLASQKKTTEARQLLFGSYYRSLAKVVTDEASNLVVTRLPETSLFRVWQRIDGLDEHMADTVQMAVATGDASWEKQYLFDQSQLRSAFRDAGKLSLNSSNKSLNTEIAKLNPILTQRLQTEEAILRAVRNHKLAEAKTLLNSKDYHQHLSHYRAESERVIQLFKGTAEASMEAKKRDAFFNTLLVAVMMLLLLSTWLILLTTLNKWYGLLQQKTNEALQHNNALIELNHNLDLMVTERTNDLMNEKTKLMQADKLASIGQLAAGVAHEINNPIGYIKLNMATLEKYMTSYRQLIETYETLWAAMLDNPDGVSCEEAVARLETLRKGINIAYLLEDSEAILSESNQGLARVQEIVGDLKDFARSDGNTVEPAEVNDLLTTTLKILSSTTRKGYTVELDLQPDMQPLTCNPGKLQQVFLNLMVNAVQAMKDQERPAVLKVTTRQTADEVLVAIADTGPGIGPELRSKIFDPFFTTKPVGEGTGLGLSITYDIIKKHGGRIELDSTVGVGTTFVLHLPIKNTLVLTEGGKKSEKPVGLSQHPVVQSKAS